MQFDKFTIKAQEAVSAANNLAIENGNQEISDIHLLNALIVQSEGVVIPLFEKLGINIDDFVLKSAAALKSYPKVYGSNAQAYLSTELYNTLSIAAKEAQSLKDDYVSTEHLLIALSESKSKTGELLRQWHFVQSFFVNNRQILQPNKSVQ